MTEAIMIQGAGSNVGKSILVAGLARACKMRGLSVAPFKPQNMSNNAAVTVDGGEIGRAQALQARAAGLDPTLDMNPVLLKPESDLGAQVILRGQRFATLRARDYGKQKHQLMPQVLQSFHNLAQQHDLILVEGAGSPAETNLRKGDIANMGFAEAADLPVTLIGDIDRGGVIAQLVGTHAVLPMADRNRIKSFIINKFRGDPTLFDQGLRDIADRTGWASIGILPWFDEAWKLPAEDILDISSRPGGAIKIAVPQLDRIANFDDLDPLANEPSITIDIIPPGQPLPGDATLVLIPGSKSTISDLASFRKNGWDIDLTAHIRRGGHVLGICGGYQMLGHTISDPDGIEGPATTVPGLGLLDVETTLSPKKRLSFTDAVFLPTGAPVQGYEIHLGRTVGPDTNNAWLGGAAGHDNAANETGRVRGCYLHGLFASDAFRSAYLQMLGAPKSALDYGQAVDQTLDALAAFMEERLDISALLATAERVG